MILLPVLDSTSTRRCSASHATRGDGLGLPRRGDDRLPGGCRTKRNPPGVKVAKLCKKVVVHSPLGGAMCKWFGHGIGMTGKKHKMHIYIYIEACLE